MVKITDERRTRDHLAELGCEGSCGLTVLSLQSGLRLSLQEQFGSVTNILLGVTFQCS